MSSSKFSGICCRGCWVCTHGQHFFPPLERLSWTFCYLIKLLGFWFHLVILSGKNVGSYGFSETVVATHGVVAAILRFWLLLVLSESRVCWVWRGSRGWLTGVPLALSFLSGVCTCGACRFAVVGATQASEKPTSSSRILFILCRRHRMLRRIAEIGNWPGQSCF